VNDFLTKHSNTIEHPPYSPDMASADFAFFPKLKYYLLQSVEYINESLRRELNSTLKTAFKNVLMIGLFVGVSVSFLKEHNLKVKK
jgi:hypothetical protein